jgi:hypothetical protein
MVHPDHPRHRTLVAYRPGPSDHVHSRRYPGMLHRLSEHCGRADRDYLERAE